MSVISFLIWPAYLAAAFMIFIFSAQAERCAPRRAEAYALGLALMCLGVGRMMFAFDPVGRPDYQWIFEVANCVLLVFVALKIRNFAAERGVS